MSRFDEDFHRLFESIRPQGQSAEKVRAHRPSTIGASIRSPQSHFARRGSHRSDFSRTGLITEGITLLVATQARPDHQVGARPMHSVTMDRHTLGKMKPAKETCCISSALEDTAITSATRLGRLFLTFDAEWLQRGLRCDQWKLLTRASQPDQASYRSMKKPTLVANRALALIRQITKSSQQAYQSDYEAMTFLHELSPLNFLVSRIVLVHQTARWIPGYTRHRERYSGLVSSPTRFRHQAEHHWYHLAGSRTQCSGSRRSSSNKSSCRWTIPWFRRGDPHARISGAGGLAALQERRAAVGCGIMVGASLSSRNAADLPAGRWRVDGESSASVVAAIRSRRARTVSDNRTLKRDKLLILR